MNKTLKINLSIICISLIFFGCSEKPKEQKKNIIESIPVKVVKVDLEDLFDTLEYVGDIKAQEEAIVYPKVSGKIVEKVKQDGARVLKGDVVAYIDRDEVGLTFQRAPVESPLTGIVGRFYVDIGQNVTQASEIALVVDMNKVKIGLNIPEKHLPKLSLGQDAKINVDAYPEQEFLGKVTKISPIVDLDTRSAPIEITVDNKDHLLKSGMFSKVRLVIEKYDNALAILKEAVMGKEPNLYVYTVDDNKAIMKKVLLGIAQGPYYEVKNGLKEGDRVVIMGQQRLYDGASVSVEE